MADIVDTTTGNLLFLEPIYNVIPDEFVGMEANEVYDAWANELGVLTTGAEVTLTTTSRVNIVTLPFNVGNTNNNVIGISRDGAVHFYDSVVPSTGDISNPPGVTVGVGSSIGDSGDIAGQSYPGDVTPSASLVAKRRNFTSESLTGTNPFRLRITDDSVIINFRTLSSPFNGTFDVSYRIYSNNRGVDMYVSQEIPDGLFGVLTLTNGAGVVEPTPANNNGTNIQALQTGGLLSRLNIPPLVLFTIDGTVQDGINNPIIRRVSAINQETKSLRSTTMSAADGTYSLPVDGDVDYIVICEDMGDNPRNALVFDRVRGA